MDRLAASDKILRLLGDPSGGSFDEDLVGDALDAAHYAILPWVFQQCVETYTGDGTTLAFELPEDCYRIVGVLDSETGLYVPESMVAPNRRPGDNVLSDQEWIAYPEGWITFLSAPETGYTMTLYYGAEWPLPVSDMDELIPPLWTHNALVYYACSYCLLKSSTEAANVRQWNVKVDSGIPTNNAMKDMSSYFLERFEHEMNAHPSRTRGNRG